MIEITIIFSFILLSEDSFTSNPAVNIKNTAPIDARKRAASPRLIKLKACGPMTIPAIIIAVTYGIWIFLASSGRINAAPTTIKKNIK